MTIILLVIGWGTIILGSIASYAIAIRYIQASRRSADYRTRQQNTQRARRNFSTLSIFVLVGVLLILFASRPRFQLPDLSPIWGKFSSPAPTATQAPPPPPSPTRRVYEFIATPTLDVSTDPTSTPLPAIPLSIEALFQGEVTPSSKVEISHFRFSTQINGNQPGIVATSFGNPIKHVYGFFNYAGFDQGVQWTAIWYRDGVLQYFQTKAWDQPGIGYGVTYWEQPVDQWLPGIYTVDLFIGHEWKTSGSFEVTGNAPTATFTTAP